jgi:hypothetical protein
MVIQYPRYYICSAKNLDLEIFTLVPAVESLSRIIYNLNTWSLKLLFFASSNHQDSMIVLTYSISWTGLDMMF